MCSCVPTSSLEIHCRWRLDGVFFSKLLSVSIITDCVGCERTKESIFSFRAEYIFFSQHNSQVLRGTPTWHNEWNETIPTYNPPPPHQKMVEWREKNRHQHFDSICLYYSHRHFNGEKKNQKVFFYYY
jgi:hypothetical protein